MLNSHKKALRQLKAANLKSANVTLAVVKEYKKDRVSQYTVKYVKVNEKLEGRLRAIVLDQINKSKVVEEYAYDSPEPEADQVSAVGFEETDFYRIYKQLRALNPEEDVVEKVEELTKSKAYMIILRNESGIQVVGFKTLPENWKMKRDKGLIPLLFRENRFEDLENDNVFSVSRGVDLFFFNETLFVISKKNFESGLNFRSGMLKHAEELYSEIASIKMFVNIDLLQEKVGNNQRYLRKIATIRNLGHYKNLKYLHKLRELSKRKEWNIQFDGEKIVITEENIDDVLILLQDKRLFSELTEGDYDVEFKKPVNPMSIS